MSEQLKKLENDPTEHEAAIETAKYEGGLGDKSTQHAWMAYADANEVPHDHEDEEPFKWGFDAGRRAATVFHKEVVSRIEKLKSYAIPKDDPHGCTPTWNAALDKAIEIIEGKTNE